MLEFVNLLVLISYWTNTNYLQKCFIIIWFSNQIFKLFVSPYHHIWQFSLMYLSLSSFSKTDRNASTFTGTQFFRSMKANILAPHLWPKPLQLPYTSSWSAIGIHYKIRNGRAQSSFNIHVLPELRYPSIYGALTFRLLWPHIEHLYLLLFIWILILIYSKWH